MPQLNPYLSFNGRCEEAMNFYQSIIGGELTMNKIGDSPIAGQCSEGMQGQVMHSMLVGEGIVLMGTDMVGGGEYFHGNSMSISLNCDSEQQIRTFFDKLSADGAVIEAVKVQFWGDLFGVFKDKFGFVWMLNCASQGARQ